MFFPVNCFLCSSVHSFAKENLKMCLSYFLNAEIFFLTIFIPHQCLWLSVVTLAALKSEGRGKTLGTSFHFKI